MIVAILKLVPHADKRREVLDILLSVKGPAMADPDCLDCCVYESCDEERSILFLELWQTLTELERHVRSSDYLRILEAMELSATIPELSYFRAEEPMGLELVERARKPVKIFS